MLPTRSSANTTPPRSIAQQLHHNLAAVLDLLPLALIDADLDIDAHLQALAEAIRARLDADGVLIRLVEAEEGPLVLRACALSEASRALGVEKIQRTWPRGSGLTGSVMRTTHSSRVGDIAKYRGVTPHAPGLSGSVITAPLIVRGRAIGVLRVSALGEDRFRPTDQRLVESLALAAGIAVENARLVHQAQEALAEAQRAADARATSLSLLEGTLESTADGIAVVDGAGNVLHFNQKLLDMWRIPASVLDEGDVKAVAIVREQMLDPSDLDAKFEAIRSRPDEDSFETLEFKDGRVFECYSRAQRIPGQRTVRVWSFRDVTERRRVEQQLLRAQRLETAGRVAGQVAHDFNNLLSPLVGLPELLRAQLPPGHRGIEYCDMMIQAAEQMAHINEDLLALGRRGHFEQSPIDLNELIRRVVFQLPPAPPTLLTRIDLAPDLLPVSGNAAQLARLVTNLVTNAIEAMHEKGTLTVRTANTYLDTPTGELMRVPIGEYVRLDVADTGTGIAPEIRQQIFDAFFTTKPTALRRGAGLGLSVVQAVVDDHDGFLDLTSEVGVGTTFTVYFRVARNAERKIASRTLVGGSESILVVDDDPFQRAVARELLGSLGYDVRVASSGEEAVRAVSEQAVDLLLLDMVMPSGIDGAETYRRVRERHPAQRAILISGFVESERVTLAQGLGAGPFVRKPSTLKELAAAVRAELDRPLPAL